MNDILLTLKKQLQHVAKFNDTTWITKELMGVDEEDNKVTAEELLPFLGEHKIKPVTRPDWFIEAMYEFNYFIDDNIEEDKKTALITEIEGYNKTGKLPDEPSWFIRAVDQYQTATADDIYNGYFPNGQKIVKFLKKVSELTIGKEVDFLKSNCVKIIESNKPESGSGMKIVITNSTASFMGMSEYFENGMTSCQQWSKGGNTGNSKSLTNNLKDPNVLLLYVTNGQKSNSMAKFGIQEHEIMKQRMLIRLIKVYSNTNRAGTLYTERNGEKEKPVGMGIMVDRSYPKADYNNEIYSLINEICEANGLMFFEPDHYNESREGGKGQKIFKKVGSALRAYDAHPFSNIKCKEYKGEGKCSKMDTKSVCNTTCKPISSEICKACKASTTISETKETICRMCDVCKLPDKNISCCECPIIHSYQFGYKDNSGRVDSNNLINTDGTMQDMYNVRRLERC